VRGRRKVESGIITIVQQAGRHGRGDLVEGAGECGRVGAAPSRATSAGPRPLLSCSIERTIRASCHHALRITSGFDQQQTAHGPHGVRFSPPSSALVARGACDALKCLNGGSYRRRTIHRAEWRDTGGSEFVNTQSFINGLCRLSAEPRRDSWRHLAQCILTNR
jgi:hypothetical protein